MLRKQHLRPGSEADEVLPVLHDLLGLHATNPLSPYLQLRARMRTFTAERLNALLDDGRAAKLTCMRGTLFIEPAESIPMMVAATREVMARGRDRFLAENGLTPHRYEELAERVAAALAGRALDARQLRVAVATNDPLPAVIHVMCDEARLVRWKGPDGWQGARQTYRLFDEALTAVVREPWDEREAIRELVDRYIRRYGPVGTSDIAWWGGFRSATVRDALACLPDIVRVDIDGLRGEFLMHARDVAETERQPPPQAREVAFLPILDPYLQGYRDRGRCVDPRHQRFVFDPKGNTTSVILVAGRPAGVWELVSEPAPELRVFLFDRPDRDMRRRILAGAADLAEVLLGTPAPVTEAADMTPLTERRGWVLSPFAGRR